MQFPVCGILLGLAQSACMLQMLQAPDMQQNVRQATLVLSCELHQQITGECMNKSSDSGTTAGQ